MCFEISRRKNQPADDDDDDDDKIKAKLLE